GAAEAKAKIDHQIWIAAADKEAVADVLGKHPFSLSVEFLSQAADLFLESLEFLKYNICFPRREQLSQYIKLELEVVDRMRARSILWCKRYRLW
ncbi:MAG: hypothetical protein ACE5E2_02295, partial [Candidatus Binatia bacterium]